MQILDAALADAERRSGEWLVCRPGCTACCIGVFAIDQLDAMRLRAGLENLCATDPARASRVWKRVQESTERLATEFPGDLETGILANDDTAAERFESFANEEPCPALDPEHGTCDLYAWRPVTCRIFGPPAPSEGGLGVCELCYHGVSKREIETCAIDLDQANAVQGELLAELDRGGMRGHTLVAFALSRSTAFSS